MNKLIVLILLVGMITLSLPAFSADEPKEKPNPNFVNPRFNIEHIDQEKDTMTNLPVILIYDQDLEVACYVMGRSISCFPAAQLSVNGHNYLIKHFVAK